jgi:hypothetical protein
MVNCENMILFAEHRDVMQAEDSPDCLTQSQMFRQMPFPPHTVYFLPAMPQGFLINA